MFLADMLLLMLGIACLMASAMLAALALSELADQIQDRRRNR